MDRFLERFLWDCHQTNTTRTHKLLANIGSGNMAWCRKTPSHYLSQCSSGTMSPYCITKPQFHRIVSCAACVCLAIFLFTKSNHAYFKRFTTHVGILTVPYFAQQYDLESLFIQFIFWNDVPFWEIDRYLSIFSYIWIHVYTISTLIYKGFSSQ